MAYTIYTYSGAYSGIGCLNLYVGTNPENGETVIREIQEELRKWKTEPMSEKEFLSAKAQLRSGYVMGLESSSGRMQSLGRGIAFAERASFAGRSAGQNRGRHPRAGHGGGGKGAGIRPGGSRRGPKRPKLTCSGWGKLQAWISWIRSSNCKRAFRIS